MVEGYANSDWFIFFNLCLSKNMGQPTIKSCAIWKKARKNLVEHWTLKQMVYCIFLCPYGVIVQRSIVKIKKQRRKTKK